MSGAETERNERARDGAQQSPQQCVSTSASDDEFEDFISSDSDTGTSPVKEKRAEIEKVARERPSHSTPASQLPPYDCVRNTVEQNLGVIGATFGNLEAESMENNLNLAHGADPKGSNVTSFVAFNGKFKHGVKNTVNVLGPQQQLTPEQDGLLTKLLGQNSKQFYKLTADRYALIISNTFDDKLSAKTYGERYKKCKRDGGERDFGKMENLLKKLGFKVHPARNVDSERLDQIIQDFKRQAARNEGSVAFIVVMSHGEDDCVLMDDMELADAYEKFVYAFSSDKTVHDIPKVFLFNMCRPRTLEKQDQQSPLQTEQPSPTQKMQTDNGRGSEFFKYTVQNTIVLFSTIPHETSLRDPCYGSFYLTKFVKILKEQYKEKSLDEMLFNVFVAVKNEHGQTPCYDNIGFKNLKFFD